jgi:hypothetical protein
MLSNAIGGLTVFYSLSTKLSKSATPVTLPAEGNYDPRAVFSAQNVAIYARCIEQHQDCSKDGNSTLSQFVSAIAEADSFNVKMTDLGYEPKKLAQLAIKRSMETIPAHRLFVEWRPYKENDATNGGIRIWILKEDASYFNKLWQYMNVQLHLTRDDAEQVLREMFGTMPKQPASLPVEDQSTGSGLMSVNIKYTLFHGCNKDGYEVFVYGFSQPLSNSSVHWQTLDNNENVLMKQLASKTVVIGMKRKMPLPEGDADDDEKYVRDLIPTALSWPGSSLYRSEDFDLREFNSVVSSHKLTRCSSFKDKQ